MYIRTKNKIYEVESSFLGKYIADTIEELCDEFVVFDKEQPNGKLLYYKGFENLKKEVIDFEKDKEKVVVYGGIWTNKGLIYVAKMNDKGELELI